MTNPNDSAYPLLMHPGLTKREMFAAMAMQGLVSSYSEKAHTMDYEMCRTAVRMADSLILELNNKP